jgi:hypothetical protein
MIAWITHLLKKDKKVNQNHHLTLMKMIALNFLLMSPQ